jgi:GNAT superfamily N-acetyltransferase
MILVRPAEMADIPALPDLERSAGKAFLDTQHAWVAGDEVMEAEDYPPLVASRAVWVAESDGALAGFATTTQHGTELHLLELAVHLEHQRKGIGRRLVEAVTSAARERGCTAVTLTTFRGVSFNAPFYGRLGFQMLETPPPHLAAVLADEAARGLTDRCAMRLSL